VSWIQSARKVLSITAPGGLTDGVSIANLVWFAFLIGSIGCSKGFLSDTGTTSSTSGTNAQHSTPNPTPNQSPSPSPAPNPSPAPAPGPSPTPDPNQSPNPAPAPSPSPALGTAFFVPPSPLGDDSNSGTDAARFATLERARQAVRAINKSM